jgi:hypothetical protein
MPAARRTSPSPSRVHRGFLNEVDRGRRRSRSARGSTPSFGESRRQPPRIARRADTAVLGAAAVRAQKPFNKPARPKKSPAPLFHAFIRRVRRELYEAYHLFLAAFRDSADCLRSGDRTAKFPLGSFPPRPALRQRLGSSRSAWIGTAAPLPRSPTVASPLTLPAVAEPRSPPPKRTPERNPALLNELRHSQSPKPPVRRSMNSPPHA